MNRNFPIPTYPCKVCSGPITFDKVYCPFCKTLNLRKVNDSSQVLPPHTRVKARISLLSDTDLRPIPRYETGPWDKLFGGGIAYESCTLVSGKSGCGKTSMLQQIANCIADQTDKPCLYVTGEMSKAQIRQFTARLGCDSNNYLMCPISGGLDIASEAREENPSSILIDSLPAVCTPERGIQFAREMNELAEELQTPIFIINHATKDNQHHGYEQVKNWVGTTILIKGKDGNPIRVLTNGTKNRFGESITMKLKWTATGFVELTEEDEKKENKKK